MCCAPKLILTISRALCTAIAVVVYSTVSCRESAAGTSAAVSIAHHVTVRQDRQPAFLLMSLFASHSLARTF